MLPPPFWQILKSYRRHLGCYGAILFGVLYSLVPVQAQWSAQDIGPVGVSGSSSYVGGVYTVSGEGLSLSGTADECNYVYQQINGDFELVAHVDSLTNESPYSLGGLMIRQSLDAGSPNASVFASAQNGVNFTIREISGSATVQTLGPSVAAPTWLNLTKVGNQVEGYVSSDGANWTLVGTNTMALSSPFYVGMAVSSNVSGTTTTAAFSGLSLLTNLPTSISGMKLWLRADDAVVSGSTVTLWPDASGNGNDAAQATGTNQPTFVANQVNGWPVLRFDGTNDYLTVPDTTSLRPTAITLFAVATHQTSSSVGVIAAKATSALTNGYGLMKTSGTDFAKFWVNTYSSNFVQSGSLSTGTFDLFAGQYDQQNLKLYRNGTLESTKSGTAAITSGTSSLYVGAFGNNSDAFKGDIAEILLFNRALTDAERHVVEGYIFNKYGVGATPTVSTPTVDPSSPGSGIYTTPQTISIDVPPGSAVYYTNDGSDPTSSSTLYTGPITVGGSEALKFKAFQFGMAASNTLTLFYVMDSSTSIARSGLVMWMRADAGLTLSGSSVSGWADESGNGNNAVPYNISNQPTWTDSALNGHPVIHFVGSGGGQILIVPDNSNLKPSQLTLIVVGEYPDQLQYGGFGGHSSLGGSQDAPFVTKTLATGTSTTSGYGIRDWDSNGIHVFVNNQSLDIDELGGGIGLGGPRPDPDVYHIFQLGYDATNLSFTCDSIGTSIPYTTAISQDTSPLGIGGTGEGTLPADSNIAEILLYNRALTSTEQQDLQAYLYSRYAIGAEPQVTAPTSADLSLVPGTIIASAENVSVSVPDGTVARYTTDGTDPTSSSDIYSAPIPISATTTLKVKFFRDNYLPSDTLSATYTMDSSTTFTRSGLVMWMRADQGLAVSGSNVNGWADESGNGNNAVAISGTAPPAIVSSVVNGQPVVRFPGGTGSSETHGLRVADNTSLKPANLEMYVVGKYATTPAGQANAPFVTKSVGDANGYGMERSGTIGPLVFLNSASVTADWLRVPYLPDTFGVFDMRYDGTNIINSVNNVDTAKTFTAAITQSTVDLSIGATLDSSTKPLSGDIAEILLFNRALTASERQDVQAYLYSRYAIGTQPQTPAPTPANLSIQPGIFATGQSVGLVVPDGYVARYTLDGSDPTSSSTLYTAGIPISLTATLKVKFFRNNYSPSTTFSANYVIDSTSTFPRTGLAMWLRADQGVTVSGSAVSVWADQSGNANNAVQATGTDQPVFASSVLNGNPVLQFNGTSDVMSVADNSSIDPTAVTAFVVGKKTSATGDGVFLVKGVGTTAWTSGYGIVDSATNAYGFINASASNKVGGPLAANTYGTFSLVYGGQGLRTSVNGLAFTNAYTTAISNSVTPLYLGASNASSRLGGEIAEVLLFNRALSDAERQQVEAYLYARYAVGSAPQVPAPTSSNLSVPPSVYTGAQTVAITVPANETATYTTDGSDPTSGSTAYTDPITISSSTILKVKFFRTGYADSQTYTASYDIDSQANFVRDGLSFWVRADQGVTQSSGTVSNWIDLSGSGNDVAQSTVADQPVLLTSQVNGQPIMRFDGTNDYLSVSSTSALSLSQMTIFAVGKCTNTSGNRLMVQKSNVGWTNGYGLNFLGQVAHSYINSGTTNQLGGIATGGNYGVYEMKYDGTTFWASLFGTIYTKAYSTAVTNDPTPLYLGSHATSNAMAGDIAEVLIYNRALTDVERLGVEGYLYQRYNLGTQPVCPSPILTPSGVFSDTQTVMITSPEPGGTIRYTTDGSDPTSSSTIYTTPLTVSVTTTVKAKVFGTNLADSAVASATYTKDTVTSFNRTGLKLWLRADQVQTGTTGAVTQWNDISGNANDAIQATGTNQPIVVSSGTEEINGQPVLKFDGTNDYLTIADGTGSLQISKATIYAVARQVSGGTSGILLVKSDTTTWANGYGVIREGSANNLGFFVNSNTTFKVTGSTIAGDTFLLQSGYDQNRSSLAINGIYQASVDGTAAITASTKPMLIGGNGAATFSFGGDIAEILVFNQPLSQADQAQVEEYLDTRYATNTDADGDGLPNWLEIQIGTDPNNPDTNGDGIPDGAEYFSAFSATSNDVDGDGLTNAQEIAMGTNPFVADGTDPHPTVAPAITLKLPTNATPLP